MLRAKRAIEMVVEKGQAVVLVPKIESLAALAEDLSAYGVSTTIYGPDDVDVRRVREHVGLSQEEFALRFGLDLDTLQNWEAGRRSMPKAVRSYMKVIEKMPEQASQALEMALVQI